MKHDWRAVLQYKLTDDEARKLIEGYGHPEVDNAPDGILFAGEKPPEGDPRVFFGTHNLLRDQTVVVCWQCELAWDPKIAAEECPGESALPADLSDLRGALSNSPPGNVDGSALVSVGRNDPCPCGSGLKFKRCHGR